jgi:hypothetical protein
MSKIYLRTKNSKDRIIMQSDIAAGFAGHMLMGTAPLQRNTEKHQAGGLERGC